MVDRRPRGATPVNAIRIAWGTPHAVRYQIQYWNGENPVDPDEYPEGRWQTFPGGAVARGGGGDITLRLAEDPVQARYLRVLLEESSVTAPPGAKDLRDALGYAVREVYIGTLDATGRLRDAVRHAPGRDVQSRFFVSSTDPWHRAGDLDPGVEQPGIDRVFASGLTRGLPVLIPVGVLYDTPDNAAALLRYLRRRGYPLRGVELGEEPDGQYAAPEDYGALYLQTADALRAVEPAATLGGPSFQSLWDEPMMAWSGTPVAPDHPWLARLLAYLRARAGRRSGFPLLRVVSVRRSLRADRAPIATRAGAVGRCPGGTARPGLAARHAPPDDRVRLFGVLRPGASRSARRLVQRRRGGGVPDLGRRHRLSVRLRTQPDLQGAELRHLGE